MTTAPHHGGPIPHPQHQPSPLRVSEGAQLRIEAAVALHALGAVIIPLEGKHPVAKGWQHATHAESSDEAIAHARQGNIGMVCGEASGIDVIDIDSDDPDQTVRVLGLAEVVTPAVKTGGGGLHLYFKHAPGLSNRVKVAPGVDIRTTGGLVVLPGSIHPETERMYEWVRGAEMPLAPFPPHLLERWATTAPATSVPAEDHAASLDPTVRAQALAQVAAEVADAVVRLRGTPEGKRNDTLNTLSHSLFLKANSGFADADEIDELLYEAAVGAGLGSEEARGTLASARRGADGKGMAASDRSVLVWTAGRSVRQKVRLAEATAGEKRPWSYWISSAILDRGETAAPLVKGLVYEGELVVPYGAPGSGKTFVVLNLALAIASGAPTWAGRKATGGQVVYVAGEGTRGILNRIRAWALHRPEGERPALDSLAGRLRVFEGAPQFLDETSWRAFRDELLGAVPSPRLVVFDTLSRCLAGKDENSAEFMTMAIGRADELRQLAGAAVLLVHHTGKDGQKERGSSALRGAADVMFKVDRDDRLVTAEFDKLKESDLPDEPLAFRLQGVELGIDEDGDAIRSAVVTFEPPRAGSLRASHLRALRALACLSPGEERTAKQWTTDAGWDANRGRSTLHGAKIELLRRGMIYEVPGKTAKYGVTENGRREARG